jgi:hypothetical protein
VVPDLARREAILARLQDQPGLVMAELSAAIDAGAAPEELPELLRLLALCRMHVGADPESGLHLARQALAAAALCGDTRSADEARVTIALADARLGRTRRAVLTSAAALTRLRGARAAFANLEYGIILGLAGRTSESVVRLRRTARALVRYGRVTAAAGAYLNASAALLEAGDARRGLAALDDAIRLRGVGADVPQWIVNGNQAYAAAIRGDALRSIELHEALLDELRRTGHGTVQAEMDRLPALLAAGLSMTASQEAARLLRIRRHAPRTRARLELALAAATMQRGDGPAAERTAWRASRRALQAGDLTLALSAHALAEEARLSRDDAPRRKSSVPELASAWIADADTKTRLHVVEARWSIRSGRLPARVPAVPASASSYTRSAVVVARMELAASRDDGRAIRRALDAAIRLRRSAVESAGVPNAPVGAVFMFSQAAAIAIRWAATRQDPQLLAQVAARAWHLTAPAAAVDHSDRMVGSATLIEFVAAGSDLLRVVTVDGRAAARLIPNAARIRRLARDHAHDQLLALRPTGTARAPGTITKQLGAALLDGLHLRRETPVLISAPASIIAVPWPALPALADVAWSLMLPGRRPNRPEADASSRVRVLVGPDLPNAASESAAVATAHRRRRVAVDPKATVSGALKVLCRRGVVHVAAHAGRRGDDPTLSWLEFHDGRLTCDELRRAAIAADLVMLSACGAAQPSGDVSAGLVTPAATLIAAGAGHVIAPTASIVHVSAEETARVVHSMLATGMTPSAALAAARAEAAGATTYLCASRV